MTSKSFLGVSFAMLMAACGVVEGGATNCASDNDCPRSQNCNAVKGICETPNANPQPTTCTTDADCKNGTRCDNKQCVNNGAPQPDGGGGTQLKPNGGSCTTDAECVSGFCDPNAPRVCKDRPVVPNNGPTRVFRIKFEVTPRTAAGNVGRRYCEGSPTLSGSRAWNGPFTPWASGDISWRSFGNDIFSSRATYLAEVTIPATNAATGLRNGMRFQCYDSNFQNGGPDVVTYGVDPRGDSVTVTEIVNGSEVARGFVRVANAPMGEGVNGAVD